MVFFVIIYERVKEFFYNSVPVDFCFI